MVIWEVKYKKKKKTEHFGNLTCCGDLCSEEKIKWTCSGHSKCLENRDIGMDKVSLSSYKAVKSKHIVELGLLRAPVNLKIFMFTMPIRIITQDKIIFSIFL